MLRKKSESWIRMSRHRGKDGMFFQHGGGNVSQAWNKKEYQLLLNRITCGGSSEEKTGLHTSVLALAVWQVAQYLLQLQNPKFLCFVSLRPVWGRCWYEFARHPRALKLVVQVIAQALLPCQLLLAFVKRNANCTTRRCTSMCAASQCTCLAVLATLSRKAQSAYAFK